MRLLILELVAAATLVSLCSAAPKPSYANHILHEKRDSKPYQSVKRDRAIGHEAIPIRIGLRQRNLEHAARYIHDVSDPESPNFGTIAKHLPIISAQYLLTTPSRDRQALDC